MTQKNNLFVSYTYSFYSPDGSMHMNVDNYIFKDYHKYLSDAEDLKNIKQEIQEINQIDNVVVLNWKFF